MPQPIPVPSSITGNSRPTGMTSPEETEKRASESSSKQASVNPSTLNAAEGKNYVLFEGTILETVLLNRLDGQFIGPVECLVTNDSTLTTANTF